MTTNIVEQMLVELMLDTSKYTAQADKAVKTNKQLEKSLTDTEKASKETEKAQKKLGEETEKAANRFNLFETTLLRATGLEKWVNDVVDAEDAAKSLAANLGLSQDALTKWQNAAKNAGGDGKGIVGLFEKLNELTVKQQATGKKNAILGSLGVDLVDTNGKARDLNKVVFELSENLRKLNRPHAYQVAKQLGMDDSTANLMMQGRNGIQQLMKKPYTEVTKAEDEIAKLIKSVQNGIKIIGKFTTVLLGNTGLLKLANDAAKANMQLTNLSTNLRINATSLQSWQNAAKTGGGTAEGMTASLTGIKQAMNGLVMFGDASMLPYFNALGVSMVDSYGKVRDMNSVMLDLADAFSKMPRDQAYTLAKQMGLDDGTFNTLVQGRKELQEILDIQKRMYHSDGEAIARSRELTKQQAILSAHWQSMKQLVGDALTPILLTLIKVVNSFFEFLQRHEKVVKAVFQTAAIVIGTLLIPTLLSAGRALLGFVAPFAPAIAAVTALAGAFLLLYDDYDTWAKGGKSLFDWTAFANGIKNSKIMIDALGESFKKLSASFSDMATEMIAKATGEKKEDIADFIGESAYRLFHGGKTYEEVNGSYTPPTKPIVIGKKGASNGAPADTAVKAADYATGHALKASAQKCAEYVNNALRAQGIKIWGHGRDVAGNLLKTGKFQSIAYNGKYIAQKGDVMSIPSIAGHPHGHVAIFNGEYWVSDYIQTNKRGNTAAPGDDYFAAIKAGKITPVIARMKSSETPNQKKTATSVPVKGNMNYAQQIYASLREHGLSAQQARIMTAEIGRENSFNPDFLFGSHTDPKNGATNIGLISWQGIRAKKLIAELTAKGLYKNGKITRSKASLDEMVKYMLSEISNNPAYSKTKKEFLDNPNVAYDKGHKILGDNYIIWRQDDPKYKSGHDRRDAFFKQTANMEMVYNANRISKGVSQSNQLAGGNTATHTDNRKYVNVNIPNMNVNTSSNTVSGNAVAAMKEVQNYTFNQLGVSMT
ncbi:hypothetical protein BGI03_09125 [Snodgrassella alvi]|uniref:CHAP domain-containing protein n=1 Tax=Snodgrassella alvi TaxID=1196083 RepID=UPI0009FFB67F|nr:CHAP domain-containing protein [Snodgrassella alvi]ORF05870.1 hypothetical protein BGH98_08160 [Snodgrassella alvi]ORF12191.1 hypothetical protein BGI01_07260 [Snodgrassella alvi]ORF16962.1 hypothetical protein BGI03_09125 [Snodgrassella alvi]ORF17868.1 hypothetical protein BGI04_09570 [Snodgrassella alvi]